MLTRRALVAGLAAAPAVARAQSRAALETADTIVLGAGLAGLNAALLLEEQGQRVIVIEAKAGAGGRLLTLADVPGNPEAGGSGIGRGYARLVDRAERLQVKLVPQRVRTEASPGSTLIHLKGRSILSKDWAGSDLNPYVGKDRERWPWLASFGALGPHNPLPDAASWRDPAFARFDRSVAAILAEKGWTPAQLRLAFATNPSYGSSADDVSALMWWHIGRNAQAMSGPAGSPPGALAISGGNQRLPEAMAEALKSPPRYGAEAAAIEADKAGVTVTTRHGARYRAKAVVVALPASAVARLRISPALPPAQAKGNAALPYNRVTQLHVVPTRRYWEDDGLPASMWTDTLAGRFMALRYGEDPNDVTSCLAFVNGAAAARLDAMRPEAATAAVLDDLARARPSTKGALKPVRLLSWANDPFAGGAYACWAPGQIAAFANELPKPHGRLFFAGEHVAASARGMEGAMESGERAALEVLETAA